MGHDLRRIGPLRSLLIVAAAGAAGFIGLVSLVGAHTTKPLKIHVISAPVTPAQSATDSPPHHTATHPAARHHELQPLTDAQIRERDQQAFAADRRRERARAKKELAEIRALREQHSTPVPATPVRPVTPVTSAAAKTATTPKPAAAPSGQSSTSGGSQYPSGGTGHETGSGSVAGQ
jgi:hypothetical protein